MGKLIIGILVGVILGFFGSSMMLGSAAGLGAAAGLSAGICSTVKAAQEEGLLDAAQVDQVLNRAASDMAAMSGKAYEGEVVNSAAECDAALEKMRQANSQ
ncbi:hypothetical protein [Primorskyibacter sp. S87]|uniref:hypothetical protein n=1 Tax=Primorskyibacter sp. S87 TaxID=3415126 RepID=UPI003C7E1769